MHHVAQEVKRGNLDTLREGWYRHEAVPVKRDDDDALREGYYEYEPDSLK